MTNKVINWEQFKDIAGILGGGGFLGFIIAIATLRISKRKTDIDARAQEAAEAKSEAEIIQSALGGNLELVKYIDAKVKEANAPLVQEIKDLRADIGKMRDERAVERQVAAENINIFRRFYERYLFWNENGRPDPNPRIRADDLVRLGMDDLLSESASI